MIESNSAHDPNPTRTRQTTEPGPLYSVNGEQDIDKGFERRSHSENLAVDPILLGSPGLQKQGSAPLRIATMRRMQQIHGNKAVQRYIRSMEASEMVDIEDTGEKNSGQVKAVQRHFDFISHDHDPPGDLNPATAVYPPPPTLSLGPQPHPIPSLPPSSLPPSLPPMPSLPPVSLPSMSSTPLSSNPSLAQDPWTSPGGSVRAMSPHGSVYRQGPPGGKYGAKRTGKSGKTKGTTRRSAAGYENPSHSHGNMLPHWEAAALSPMRSGMSEGEKRKWLMKKERRFEATSPGRSRTKTIKGHGKGVLGHGESAGSNWNREGHKRPRTKNMEHNRQSSAYHGIEDRDWSNASGASEERYMSPGPHRESAPSYWNPKAPGYQGGPWHSWELETPASYLVTTLYAPGFQSAAYSELSIEPPPATPTATTLVTTSIITSITTSTRSTATPVIIFELIWANERLQPFQRAALAICPAAFSFRPLILVPRSRRIIRALILPTCFPTFPTFPTFPAFPAFSTFPILASATSLLTDFASTSLLLTGFAT